jgi:hypothetical protein
MLVIMEKPWFGKMFSRSQKSRPAVARPGRDHVDAEAQFGRGLQFATGAGAAQDYAQATKTLGLFWRRKHFRRDGLSTKIQTDTTIPFG